MALQHDLGWRIKRTVNALFHQPGKCDKPKGYIVYSCGLQGHIALQPLNFLGCAKEMTY
jgi:hypothetical protein